MFRRKEMFSYTLSFSRAPFWNTTPKRRSSRGTAFTSRPPAQTTPSPASYSRISSAARVLFPLPVGPRTPRVSPRPRENVTSARSRSTPR